MLPGRLMESANSGRSRAMNAPGSDYCGIGRLRGTPPQPPCRCGSSGDHEVPHRIQSGLCADRLDKEPSVDAGV